MKRRVILITAHLVGLVLIIFFVMRGCSGHKRPIQTVPLTPVAVSSAPVVASTLTVVSIPVTPNPTPVPKKTPKLPAPPKQPPVATPIAPPPVVIHKELIPKDIDIVRVYYESSIAGPSSSIPFDINGSGFTKEFEQMIKVESGNPDVEVKELQLVTLNQIHGTLLINEKTKTTVNYPQVLISGKVVFRAEEPFAVIRPNEVLNLIFTEMGESGRNGRFRVFTNLTPDMFSKFSVVPSTPSIDISSLTPDLPFVVEGTLNIGRAQGGTYGIGVVLDGKKIWNREGIIRVVRPNVGQTGLIQRLQAADGYQRPGDDAHFLVYGSGFQAPDSGLLRLTVDGWEKTVSSFSFVAPGLMELNIKIPVTAALGKYIVTIFNGDTELLKTPNAFTIVPGNWARGLSVDPALNPGGQTMLTLSGRDLKKDFIDSIKVDVDEPGLKVGPFSSKSPTEAVAAVSAAANVAPGDYLIKLTANSQPINPHLGSIIRVTAKK